MKYGEFVGQVQHRLEFAEQGRAVRATRATLTTLGERLQEGEAKDLAGPLPMEIDRYLLTAESGQRFDLSEFDRRVADREGIAESDARYHAKVLVALVSEVVPAGEIEQVRNQLPEAFDTLFEFVNHPLETE